MCNDVKTFSMKGKNEKNNMLDEKKGKDEKNKARDKKKDETLSGVRSGGSKVSTLNDEN